VKEFIASVFAGADPYRGGGTSVRAVDLLRQAEARIDQIASEYPETRIELLTIIGSSLLLLQDTAAAESSVMRAAEEGRMQLGAEHPLTLDARLLSTQVHRFRGRTAEMRAELDALVPIFRQRPDRVEDLVNALQYRSHAALDDGRYEEAERAATEGLTLAEARLGRRHSATVQLAMSLAQTYQYGRPRPEQALEASERAMRLVSDLHADPTYPRVVDMRHIYARALGGAGEYGRGIDELERAIRDAEAAVGPEGRKVAFMRSNLARIQRRAGQLEAAIRNATASSAILARDFAPDSWSYAGGIVSRGIIYLTARRADDAWIDLDRASTGLAKTMGPDHVQVFIARYYLQLARAYRGQVADAESTLRQLIAGFRSDDPSDRAVFGPPLHALGIIERLAGRFDAALATQREALGKFDEGVAGALDRLHVRTEIGLNQVALGRPAEAVETLRPAVADFTAIQIAPTPQRADALVGLGCAYLELGRPADAVPILEEADAFWRSFDAGNRWAGEAALWLGRAYAAVGRQAKARAASSRAVLILSRSPLPLDAALVRLAQR
jgi:tetratricopeptide (TPR) repeat protein